MENVSSRLLSIFKSAHIWLLWYDRFKIAWTIQFKQTPSTGLCLTFQWLYFGMNHFCEHWSHPHDHPPSSSSPRATISISQHIRTISQVSPGPAAFIFWYCRNATNPAQPSTRFHRKLQKLLISTLPDGAPNCGPVTQQNTTMSLLDVYGIINWVPQVQNQTSPSK